MAIRKSGPGGDVPSGDIMDPSTRPRERTVRFRRWWAGYGAAWQAGQQAGFSPAQAAELERLGVAVIVPDTRTVSASGLVRK